MKKVLIVSGHPDIKNSLANKAIFKDLENVENISINNLANKYPDYKIDVEKEQELLLSHDIIIFQFPFYWYSVPGIMKKWMDDVFTYGFAYGSTGDKLKGKEFIISTTIGGPKESYTPESFNTYPIDDLLKPLKQTSNLTGMNWNKPIVSHGMVYIPDVYNTQEGVLERAKQHSEELIKKIEVLRNKDSVESK